MSTRTTRTSTGGHRRLQLGYDARVVKVGRSLLKVFKPAYVELAAMTCKPMIIAQTASTEIVGDKATWIRRGLLQDVPSEFPRIRALIWFKTTREQTGV